MTLSDSRTSERCNILLCGNMAEDLQTNIITEFFNGGWRVAPFIKTAEGYIGVKAWPKRAATNPAELQELVKEQSERSSKVPILGIVPSKGRYVVDIDTKKNASALQLWKDKVIEAYGDVKLATPNLIVKTKSGGYHLYYSDGSDRQLHSPTSVFGKDSGVDIRGYTGMVIAPTAVGTEMDWQLGEYVIVKGRPTDPLTVLGLAKIIGETYDEADSFIRQTLVTVNECLRNDSVNELHRHKLIPNELVIPSSNRDNTLYRCAKLCRLAGLSQDSALLFMTHIAHRCEATPEEPVEHWIKLAHDKVKRVYSNEAEIRLKSVSSFYEEMDNAGTVLLRGVSKSYYYFRHGSKLLRIEPRSRFSTDNIGNVLQGVSISTDDGEVPVKKVVTAYSPKSVAYNAAMYPRENMPFFEYEGLRYVNTYYDPFSAFEPVQSMLDAVRPYVDRFTEFALHITGYEHSDADHLLDKLAWMVQKPYRRLPTGTIIYSHTRGSGKDVFMALVREIIGRQYYMPITLQSIENPHTMFHDKLVCTASEVQLQTNARGTIAAASFMGRLKDIITAKTVYVDEKFVQPYSAPIFTNFFILSNFELSSILEPGDRRFDVFHAHEEKLDQSRFGDLADLTNDGIWVERSSNDNLLRKHAIYAIRMALMNREVAATFDRQEAVMNEVKKSLMDVQSPPALEWLKNNLPTYFTEDVAMMACYFCPVRATPEYVMKQLKEHYGPEMKPIYRSNRVQMRVSGAPKIEKRNDGLGGMLPILNFDQRTSDTDARKPVYTLSKIYEASPSDAIVRADIRRWYDRMVSQYYGNVTILPAQKPGGSSDLP